MKKANTAFMKFASLIAIIFSFFLTACEQENISTHNDNKPAVKPETKAPEAQAPEALEQSSELQKGETLYRTYCLACHQANGGGVPNMQPALVGSALLKGDKDALVSFVLTAMRENPSDEEWLGVMAAFSYLSDEDLAAILTYARAQFVEAGEISIEDVARVRASLAQ